MKIFLVMLVSAGLLFSLSKQKIFYREASAAMINCPSVTLCFKGVFIFRKPQSLKLLSSLFFVFTGWSIFWGWHKLQWEFQQCFHHWWIRNDPSFQCFQLSESTTHVYCQFWWFLWQRRSFLSHLWQHHPHRSNPKAKRTLWSAASTSNSRSFFCTSTINCQAQLS